MCGTMKFLRAVLCRSFKIGECVAKELKDANLRPVEAGSNLRIGVLANETISTSGLLSGTTQEPGMSLIINACFLHLRLDVLHVM